MHAYLIRDESGEVVVAFRSKRLAEEWLDRHAADERGFTIDIVESRKELIRADA